MKVMAATKEIDIANDFKAWSDARETLEVIREKSMTHELNMLLEEYFYGQSPSKNDINDFLWIEKDYIALALSGKRWVEFAYGA